jgi:hypothetical protein
MKNISPTQIVSKSYCYDCKIKGFFCYTPQGADYYTCPYCGDYDEVNFYDVNNKYNFLYINDYSYGDMRLEYYYCNKCRIMFDIGCTHAENGCTSNTYNGHVISVWKDKTTGIIYNGSVQFDSTEEWFEKANDIVVLEERCLNNGSHCVKGSYPKLLYPKYYSQCKLV